MLYNFDMIFKNNNLNKHSSFRNLPPTTYHLKPVLGFTLIEMLVVIAVIGILYGIVMASVSDSKKRGRDSKRIADISVIQLALERYYDHNKKYPSTLNILSDSSDPDNYDPSVLTKDPSDKLYVYSCVNSCQSYHLGANLELNNPILKDDTLDKDDTRGFDGVDNSDCAGGLSGSGNCYDVLPKF